MSEKNNFIIEEGLEFEKEVTEKAQEDKSKNTKRVVARKKRDDEFAYNLHRLRKDRKLTMEELANRLNKRYNKNISKSMISRWERGFSATLETVKMLSDYFGVTINELLGFNLTQTRDTIPIYLNKNLERILKLRKENFSSLDVQTYILGYGSLPLNITVNQKNINDLFFIQIYDDYMDRKYVEESLVLIQENTLYKNGDDLLVKIEGKEEAVLGRFYEQKELVLLLPVSDNKNNEPVVIDTTKENMKILGKAIAVISPIK